MAYWWILVPVAIFLATRLLDVGLLLAMHGHQAARVDQPGFKVVDPAPASPGYWDMLTNWDGQWYQEVAEHGYPRSLPVVDGHVQPNAWAFSPAYPMLVRLVMEVTHLPFEVAASATTLIASAAAMVLLYRMVRKRSGTFQAGMAVLALCVAPAAPVFQMAYSEGLALLVVLGCIEALAARRYSLFGALTVVLAFTRPVVAAMALLLLVQVVLRWRQRHEAPIERRERRRLGVTVVVALVSVGLWPACCALVTRHVNGFLETQAAWTTGRPSWLSVLVHHPFSAAGVLAVVLIVGGLLLVTRREARGWPVELRLWVPSYGAYLLMATSPLGTALRYALLSVAPWWPVVQQTRLVDPRRRVVVVLFVIALGVVSQVAWLRFLYLPGPDQVLWP